MLNKSLLVFLILITISLYSNAEPYLAVRTGLKCMSCHITPTGGGMRNEVGQAFGRGLAASHDGASYFNSNLSENIKIGGDFRSSLQSVKTPGEENQLSFNTDRASIYLSATLLENLSLYIDQQQAPSNENRTAWAMYQSSDKSYYIRSGKFFTPYGLRLEDDAAFIRQVTGINFATADNGLEFGLDNKSWSSQLSITNGTAGASENNTDKQLSLRVAYIAPNWRFGSSLNTNESPSSSRDMINVFGALKLFNSEWLFELDQIDDETTTPITKQVLFFEVNKEILKGHNLKITFESEDPNTDVEQDQRTRNSIVWEYFPIPHIQIRTGARIKSGIPQKPLDNSDELFINLHAWF